MNQHSLKVNVLVCIVLHNICIEKGDRYGISSSTIVLANLFMGHNEKLWIENFQGTPPTYYRRHAGDIFFSF